MLQWSWFLSAASFRFNTVTNHIQSHNDKSLSKYTTSTHSESGSTETSLIYNIPSQCVLKMLIVRYESVVCAYCFSSARSVLDSSGSASASSASFLSSASTSRSTRLLRRPPETTRRVRLEIFMKREQSSETTRVCGVKPDA